MVSDSLSRNGGGVFESVLRQSQELQRAGQDVRVFGLRDEYSAEDADRWGTVETAVVAGRGPTFFGWGPGLGNAIASWNPDVIHSHGIWKYTSIASSFAARRTGSSFVLSPHGMLESWAVQNQNWKKRIAWMAYERHTFAAATCVHALNAAELAAVRAFGIERPVGVVPNGVDLADQGERDFDVEQVLPRRKVLLYLGRIHPKKGLSTLLEAWARAFAHPGAGAAIQGWTLVLAGWGTGSHADNLRRLARSLKLGDTAIFIGPQFGADKDQWYRRCDAVVLPSLSEGLPMGVLEAWSYAKPVLMTPQCNLPEGTRAGAAIEAEPSVDGLAAAIMALVASSSLERQEMGHKGRCLVRDHFSWPACSSQMIALYEWTLHRGPAPNNVYAA